MKQQAASAAARMAQADRLPRLAIAFVVCLAIPLVFHIGPLRMTPYRVVLVASFAPLVGLWLAGRLDGIKPPDLMAAFYALWAGLSLVVNHGLEKVELAGITAIEILGAYLLARASIRGPNGFRAFVRTLLWVTLALIPFAFVEAVFYRRLFQEALGGLALPISSFETRWGMLRAAASFEHPILFGVFAASGLAMSYYALRGDSRRWPMAALVAGAGAFFSLSLGAYVALAAQLGLIVYDRLTEGRKGRWRNLIIVIGAVYAFLLVASNRGPILIFIQTFAFNSFSSAVRIQTWHYGTDVVLNNPIFGIGLDDNWPRPHWLTHSVDNFWLLNAMRYGLPAAIAIAGMVLWTLLRLGARPIADPQVDACRKGLVMSLVAMCVAAATVHYWGTIFVYFMFLLGAGSWLLEWEESAAPATSAARGPASALRRRAPDEAPAPQPGPKPARRPVASPAPPRGLPLGTGPRRG